MTEPTSEHSSEPSSESTSEPSSAQRPERPFDLRWAAASLLAIGGVLGATLLVSQCSRQRSANLPETSELAEGARLYRTYCGLCHGDDGEGYAADDANALANQQFLASVSDEFLRENIALGHPGTSMAAYASSAGGPLSDAEIDTLVAFIRNWQDVESANLAEAVEGDAEAARDVYARECAACHGDRGQGASALSLNNPVFLRSASDGQIDYAIRHGRSGTPMPAFEGELAEASISNLVALIRSWDEGESDVADSLVAMDGIGDGPIVLNPDGEAAEFSPLREGRYVPSEEVAEALDDGRRIVFLDARAPSDYVRFHVVGAVPSPYYAVGDIVERLPRDGTWIVAYCGCPHAASGRVMDRLRDEGFENTAVLDEGVIHWEAEGYPVVRGPEPGTMADAE